MRLEELALQRSNVINNTLSNFSQVRTLQTIYIHKYNNIYRHNPRNSPRSNPLIVGNSRPLTKTKLWRNWYSPFMVLSRRKIYRL